MDWLKLRIERWPRCCLASTTPAVCCGAFPSPHIVTAWCCVALLRCCFALLCVVCAVPCFFVKCWAANGVLAVGAVWRALFVAPLPSPGSSGFKDQDVGCRTGRRPFARCWCTLLRGACLFVAAIISRRHGRLVHPHSARIRCCPSPRPFYSCQTPKPRPSGRPPCDSAGAVCAGLRAVHSPSGTAFGGTAGAECHCPWGRLPKGCATRRRRLLPAPYGQVCGIGAALFGWGRHNAAPLPNTERLSEARLWELFCQGAGRSGWVRQLCGWA